MSVKFRVTQGDRPTVTDALTDDAGAVSLTGAAVQFRMQGPGGNFAGTATIVNAAAGTVSYQFAAEDVAVPGIYQAQWQMTKDGITRTFPTGSLANNEADGEYIVYEVVPALPVTAAANTTLIGDFYELIRAVLGDFKRRKYEDEAIASVVRTIIKLGHIEGYAMAPDNRSITPAITDGLTMGRIVYRAALMFVRPHAAAYAYDTRAVKERFGDQRTFVLDLESLLSEVEEGDGILSFQSLYAWVNGMTGLNLAAQLTEVSVATGVATIRIDAL